MLYCTLGYSREHSILQELIFSAMYKFPQGIVFYKKDDEYMTPYFVLKEFFDYTKIDKNEKIWEPFIGDGTSVEKMKRIGYKNVHSEDVDFFKATVPSRDTIIVTNPPFSIKREILDYIINGLRWERFALLLPVCVIFTRYFHKIIEKRKDLQIDILVPYSRVQYLKNGKQLGKCSFDSCWLVSGIDLGKSRKGYHFMPRCKSKEL